MRCRESWMAAWLLLALSGPAHADFPPRVVIRIANADGAIPSNGGVLIVGEAVVPSVLVTASDGAFVHGTFEDRGFASGPGEHYWVWIASAPLTPGVYSFDISTVTATIARTEVTFGEPWSPMLPQLAIDPSPLEPWSMRFNASCAESIASDPTQPTSFDIDRWFFSISPNASTSEPAGQVGQYLFRARPTQSAPGVTPFVLEPLATLRGALYAENADAYCFVIEALEIVSGTTTLYPDAHCISSADAGDIGTLGFDYQPDDLARLTLPQCAAPPIWHEEAWCTVNEATCAQPSAPAACAIYCEERPSMQPEAAGMSAEQPSEPSELGESGEPGEPGEPMVASDGEPAQSPTHASGGCQLVLRGSAPSLTSVLFMLAAFGAYRTRRRSELQRSVKPS